jgi:hypothetical protein
MRSIGSFGKRKWQRRASAIAVTTAIAVITGTIAVGGPARGAVIRPAAIPADRAYPVLVGGQNSAGAPFLTEIGPTWEVAVKLPNPAPNLGFGLGDVVITPNGKYAYAAVGDVMALIGGVNTSHPKVASTVKPGGQVGAIALTRNGAYAYVSVTTGTYPNMTGIVRVYSGVSSGKPKLVATIKPGGEVGGVTFAPNGAYAYVPVTTGAYPGTTAIIRGYSGVIGGKPRLVTSVSLGAGSPDSMAITPDGKYSYVASSGQLYVAVLQQISGIGTAHLKVDWTDDDAGTRGSGVWGVTPNGKYVYFAGGPAAYGSIDIYKTQTARPALAKAFGFDAGPTLLIGPGGRWAYAGLSFLNGTSTIHVISGPQSAPKLAGTARLPHGALPEVMQPDGAYGYGASWNDAGLGKPSWVVAFSGASTGHLAGTTSWKLPYQVTHIEVSPVKA